MMDKWIFVKFSSMWLEYLIIQTNHKLISVELRKWNWQPENLISVPFQPLIISITCLSLLFLTFRVKPAE